MTAEEFLDGMNRLRDTWGSIHFSASKEAIIAKKISWLLSEEWNAVIDQLISSSRYAPTPSEIYEAVRVYKKAHPDPEQESVSIPILCYDCYETGWLKVAFNEEQSFCFCHCPFGIRESLQTKSLIPIFKENIGITKLPFPLESFIPRDGLASLMKESRTIKWWKKEREGAEYFWITLNQRGISEIRDNRGMVEA